MPLEAHTDAWRRSTRTGIIVARGPLLDDDGSRMTGSLLIVDVADRDQAQAFWAGGPFVRSGIYGWWTLERWRFGHV
jgi:uncharacterized protein